MSINFSHEFSSDIDEAVCTSIESNFKPKRLYGDVEFRNNSYVPKVDLYVAGFPCQPFSSAGKQQGFGDSRGSVFYSIIDYLFVNKPKVFILENVKGFTTLNQGKCRKEAIEKLSELGSYNIHHKVLNTKDHGIPQNRERWYCVGIRTDVDNQSFSFPDNITCQHISKFLNADITSDSTA